MEPREPAGGRDSAPEARGGARRASPEAKRRGLAYQPPERTLSVLADLSQDVLGYTELAGVLGAVAEGALDLLGANHASVRLVGEGIELLPSARAGAGTDAPPPRFAMGQGVIGWVAEHGRVARIDDSEIDPRFDPTPDRGFVVRSLLSVPMCGDGRVLGVLSMSSPDVGAFDTRAEHVGKLLAAQASQAVRLAELRELSVTDAHTRAYNRRYLLPRLREEMARSNRTGEPLSVLLLDLDHFKRVNDHYGHGVGDVVLRRVADQVRGQVRTIDVLIRRGGEEFVLILPGTPAEGALEAAERIRAHVMNEAFEVAPRMFLVQTLSIGAATWNGAEGARDLDRRADMAMYVAKREGRNRVVASERDALVEDGATTGDATGVASNG